MKKVIKGGIIMYKCTRRSCGLDWTFDPADGKCPVCRGNIVPESMWQPAEPSRLEKIIEVLRGK